MRSAQARALLGDRMRELRECAGVSLTRSAELSGWSKSHLSRVERGATRPSLPLVEWYDRTFGARQALVRQYLDLDTAVREARLLSLRELREPAIAGSPRVTVVEGGPVPADYDPRDRSLLSGETVPDGTLLEPAQRFVKSWTIRNAGPIPWRDRYLTRQGAPGAPGWLQSEMQVPIPPTDPGSEATISVTMRTPRVAGMCTAYFKITDKRGLQYFPRGGAIPLYCTIFVPE